MLIARFFIYQCKYSELKPNTLDYFNVLNMTKTPEYVIAKRSKSKDEHYKKWKYICNFI